MKGSNDLPLKAHSFALVAQLGFDLPDIALSERHTFATMDRPFTKMEGFSTANIEEDIPPPPRPQRKGKPLPVRWMDLPNKDQLFILALCRLSEPLSNTCLLPYIYYLIKSIVATSGNDPTKPETDQISKLSGILVAVFPLAQFFTSMLWARQADTRGRRFVILAGLLGSAISNLAFGFSRSFWALMFWRTLAGISNGNVGVMRTMTAEIVKERKYQTRAFLLLPLIFNAGMVAGLALGGCLADPAVNLPWLFGPTGIFNLWNFEKGVQWAVDYPYALPAMFNVSLLITGLLLAVLGLKETLAGREGEKHMGINLGRFIMRSARPFLPRRLTKGYAPLALDDLDDTGAAVMEEEKPTPSIRQSTQPRATLRSVCTREVLCAMVSFGLLPLHNSAFMHVFPVYLSNPPADNSNATVFSFNGGLGLRSPSIGLWLGLFGICGILLQLFIYPRLQARIGTLGVFRIALFMFPVTYAIAPYLSLVPRSGFMHWFSIAIVAWSQIMARTLAIPSTVILLTDSAPMKSSLSTVHGAGNMLSSLARAIGPAVGGWVFAWGMNRDVIGAVWWFYLTVIAIGALIWSYTMKKNEDLE
jgi:predicted MFS family arabinose efflux permease